MSINIEELTANLNIHQSLADQPALLAEDLKKEWDKPANIIKEYINETLIPKLTDVLETEVTDLKDNLKAETIKECYPVGITIAFNDSLDHSKFCDLNWERVGEGRFLVGYKEGDADFGEAGKTGGNRRVTIKKQNIPNYDLTVIDDGHNHTVPVGSGGDKVGAGTPDRGKQQFGSDSSKTGIKVNSGGSGEPLDITPLYEVRAFWTRVS